MSLVPTLSKQIKQEESRSQGCQCAGYNDESTFKCWMRGRQLIRTALQAELYPPRVFVQPNTISLVERASA